MMPLQDVNYLTTLVERDLSKPNVWLRIHPALQSLFDAENARAKTRETIIAILIGLVIFNAFLINDYISAGRILPHSWILHFIVVTLPCLGAIWVIRKGNSERLRNIAIVCTSVLIALGACGDFLLMHNPKAIYEPFAYNLLFTCTNNLTPIRFRFALLASILDLAIITGTTLISPLVPINCTGMATTIFVITALVTLSANYRLEKNVIANYLNLLLKSLHQFEMREANRHLKNIARKDPLTGLTSRREFEAEFERTWEEAINSLSSYTVLMIDIDHLKSFNDRYGRPAGDECLRQVARAIEMQTRSKIDVVARLGGEEFCVLLANATARQAQMAAERIQLAVEQLAIPHEAIGEGAVITISIGAASAIARLCDNGQQVLAAADSALHEAKRSGKNQNRVTTLGISA
jgi:diguanylate cyclase (GGDEF)-like protein